MKPNGIVRILLMALFSLAWCAALFAAPMNGSEVELTQPGGGKFKVKVYGDEFHHRLETNEGHVVVWDTARQAYCYARLSTDGDEFESTGIPLGRKLSAKQQARLQNLDKKIRISNKSIGKKAALARKEIHRDGQGRIELPKAPLPLHEPIQYSPPPDGVAAAEGADPAAASAPIAGNLKVLALLVQFPDRLADVKFTQPELESRLNAIPYSYNGEVTSCRGYFKTQSHDQLDLVHVMTPYFTAPNNIAYYYDPNRVTKILDLMRARLEQLKTGGFNFAQLDGNGDGVADCINLLVPGGFDAGIYGWAGTINWSGFATYGLAADCPMTVTFVDSIFQICHELGHAVCDMPDLYSYDGNAAACGNFCLMSASWDKHFPSVSAPLKYQAGWISAVDIPSTATSNHTLSVDATSVLRYVNPDKANEYFMFEMRSDTGYEGIYGGATNDACFSKGLVIYHVTENGSNGNSSIFTADNPNCNYTRPPKILVVEDNPQRNVTPWYDDPTPDSEDAFDTGDVIDGLSTPELAFWSSRGRTIASGLRISNIQVNASTLTFSVQNDNPPPITASSNPVKVSTNTTLSVNATGISTYSWTKVLGPGTVTFGSPSAATTTASFNTIGEYVVRVTMSDGINTTFNEKTILVTAGLDEYVGFYNHFPVTEPSWHTGWVEYAAPQQLQWRDPSGWDWNLNASAETDVFLTDSTCPYGANKKFTFKRLNGQITGFDYLGWSLLYSRVSPVGNHLKLATPKNVPLGVTLTASDADSLTTSLSYSVVKAPTNGALTGTAPNLTYTPNSNFSGGDSFTFRVFDGTYYSNIATVNIIVYDTGNEPQFSLVVMGGNGDGKVRVGQQATITADAAPLGKEFDKWLGDVGALANPNSASTTLIMPASDVYVTASYKAAEYLNEYVGYYKKLPIIDANWDTGWIEFSGSQLKWRNPSGWSWNLLPTAQTDVLVTDDTCAYGPGLTYSFLRQNGRIVSFNYLGTGNIYTRYSPVAVGASVVTLKDTPIATTLSASDAQSNPITYTVVTQPAHGTLSGTIPNLIYTPTAGYLGMDSFTFKVNNGESDSNIAKISITVRTNVAPTVDAGLDQTVNLTTSSTGNWTPAHTSTAAWYDAADSASITQASSVVSQWNDKSGNGRNVAQATSGKRPLLTTLNSKAAIRFDASDDSLVTASYIPSGNLSIYIVAASNRQTLGETNKLDVLLSTQTSGANPGITLETYNGYGVTNKRWLRSEGVGTTSTEYVDGILDTDSEIGYQTPHVFSVLANASVGANPLRIGRIGSDVFYGNHFIHEIIIVNGQDSIADRQKMEGYLAHKWGMSGSLPADHPYKASAPVHSTTTAVASLDGTVTDDDSFTSTWSVASGPAAVTFANPAAVDTTATFTVAGTYTLRLTVNDGFSSVSDEVVITVGPPLSTKYLTWAGGSFTNPFVDKNLSSNPDGDGRSNLMEFGFGTDPTLGDSGPLAVDGSRHGEPALNPASGGGFDLYFLRRLDQGSSGSVTYTVRFSSDLNTFYDNNNTANPIVVVGPSSVHAAYEVVKVRYPSSLPDGKAARFGSVRLEATP